MIKVENVSLTVKKQKILEMYAWMWLAGRQWD